MSSTLEQAAGSAHLCFTQFCSCWFVCVCVHSQSPVRSQFVPTILTQFPSLSSLYLSSPSLQSAALLRALLGAVDCRQGQFVCKHKITFNVSQGFTATQQQQEKRKHVCGCTLLSLSLCSSGVFCPAAQLLNSASLWDAHSVMGVLYHPLLVTSWNKWSRPTEAQSKEVIHHNAKHFVPFLFHFKSGRRL